MASSVILGSRRWGKSSLDVFWFFLFMYKNLQPKIEFSIHVSACLGFSTFLFGQRGWNGHEETVAVGKEPSRGLGGREERASGGHPKGLFPVRLQTVKAEDSALPPPHTAPHLPPTA